MFSLSKTCNSSYNILQYTYVDEHYYIYAFGAINCVSYKDVVVKRGRELE